VITIARCCRNACQGGYENSDGRKQKTQTSMRDLLLAFQPFLTFVQGIFDSLGIGDTAKKRPFHFQKGETTVYVKIFQPLPAWVPDSP
jgi:hypothetical protein